MEEEQTKIGMCCYCGDQLHKSKTVLISNGDEVCFACVELYDLQQSEEILPDDPEWEAAVEGAWERQQMGAGWR